LLAPLFSWDLTAMTAISAPLLINQMIQLAPESAPALARLAESVASGTMGMPAFCARARSELRPTLLMEALLALRGVQISAADVRSLYRHCATCEDGDRCPIGGCAVLDRFRQHANQHHAKCTSTDGCPCSTWGFTKKNCKSVTLPAHNDVTPVRQGESAVVVKPRSMHSPTKSKKSGPILAVAVPKPRPTASAPAPAAACERATTPGATALMMLSRAALGDISTKPNSPSCSPCNSPRNSPKRLRLKRNKRDSTEDNFSLDSSSALSASAPKVARASSAASMPMGPLAGAGAASVVRAHAIVAAAMAAPPPQPGTKRLKNLVTAAALHAA